MNQTTENYLKGIYSLSRSVQWVSTNSLAERMETKASSVTDMLKKLNEKGLVKHAPYRGTQLTIKGKKIAIEVVRKHRLWECFLVDHLHFGWDEVHDIAEQLEHIESEQLTERLDQFLGHPKFDPHGDPIPDKNGVITDRRNAKPLSEYELFEEVIVVGVVESSNAFLKYLQGVKLTLGTPLQLLERFEFDQSINVRIGKKEMALSKQVADNLLVGTKG